MRLLLLSFTAFVLFTYTSSAQRLDRNQELSEVDRLFYTCKIWGYLKYYHPLVGRGAYNWDEQLQKVLKLSANIKTYEGFSTYMDRFIYAMGARKPCMSCRKRSRYRLFLKNFDLSWTQSSIFSKELRTAFTDIENNRVEGDHYYIGKGKLNQFEPKNEQPDHDFYWEDEYQRLLPLFRYWNYVEYFYPYKYLTDQSWDDVLKEMIPKFLQAKTKLDLHLAILELVVKLDDSNAEFTSFLIEQMPYFNYLPVRLEMIDGQVMVAELIDQNKARSDDWSVGDVLLKVNNQSVRTLHETNKKYLPASNRAVKDRNIYYSPFIGMKERAQVTLNRKGSEKTHEVTLYKKITDLNYTQSSSSEKWTTYVDSMTYELGGYDTLTNETFKYDSTVYLKTGYVDMGRLVSGEVDQMMNEFSATQAIIFDVRNNPKGTYQAIAKHLNPSEKTFASFTRPDLTYPGKFIWEGNRTCGETNPDYYKGKVILLVNEKTQSHAEFTCMCLQTAPDVTTIGSQTGGANSSVSRVRILQRLRTSLAGLGVYYPDKREIQRVGIVPDVEIKPTAAGIREGRDEVLERAVVLTKDEIRESQLVQLEEIARMKEAAIQEAIAKQQMMERLETDTTNTEVMRSDTLKLKNGDFDR